MQPLSPLAYRRRRGAKENSAVLSQVVAHKVTDWTGKRFVAEKVSGLEIDFPIRANGCTFEELLVEDTTFSEHIDLSRSAFTGTVTFRNVKFKKGADFGSCVFEGALRADTVYWEGPTSFYRADFCGDVSMRARFTGNANFNEAVFREAARLTGWHNINLRLGSIAIPSLAATLAVEPGNSTDSTKLTRVLDQVAAAAKDARTALSHCGRGANIAAASAARWLLTQWGLIRRRIWADDSNVDYYLFFEREGQFSSVQLLKPAQIVFENVNLSNVFFDRTNLRGVRFFGVNFRQSSLNRNGLRDEVFALESRDLAFRKRQWPLLEETCRSARVAMEENKNFIAATDFYVAEMEAHRKQMSPLRRHLFSIPALYRAVSQYGSSVGVALRMVILLMMLHFSLTVRLNVGQEFLGSAMHDAALHSARLMLYQSEELSRISATQAWVDLLFRIIGTAQLAMVVLAFRAKVKRN